MVLRWTTFVLGLLMAAVVAGACIPEALVVSCEPTTEVELAGTPVRCSRLAPGIEAPRHGARELAHEHPPLVPTRFGLAAPVLRVALVATAAQVRGVNGFVAPDVVARGPPGA
jgi:hypothetical protein